MSHAASVYRSAARGADFGNSVSWLIISIPAFGGTFGARGRRDLPGPGFETSGRASGQVHRGGEARGNFHPNFGEATVAFREQVEPVPHSPSHHRRWHAVAAKSGLCSLCPTLYLGKAAWLAVSVVQLLPLVRAVGHVARCLTHCHNFFDFLRRPRVLAEEDVAPDPTAREIPSVRPSPKTVQFDRKPEQCPRTSSICRRSLFVDRPAESKTEAAISGYKSAGLCNQE